MIIRGSRGTRYYYYNPAWKVWSSSNPVQTHDFVLKQCCELTVLYI